MRQLLQHLGPGLLFAGAAVGVSHLVYSTKAGALYGYGLVWAVILANLCKYPFFEFGPRYAAVTGQSLLQGYRRLGRGVLGAYILMTVGTMFTVQAAVTLVTAGLAGQLLGMDVGASLTPWFVGTLLLCGLILWVGRYQVLDQLMKWVVLALTVLTLLTVIVASGQSSHTSTWAQVFPTDETGIVFLLALMGWMPAPLDLSVWHSLWALEKRKSQADFNLKRSLFDFNVGYVGTLILALFFVALGALQMYGSGVVFAESAGGFSAQLIQLYAKTLGPAVGMFVSVAAFCTMFSTCITCLDAMPRSLANAQRIWRDAPEDPQAERRAAQAWMLVLIVGALVVYLLFFQRFSIFLAVATILSFLTAPFFAVVNYRLITSEAIPLADQPPRWMRVLSALGLVYLLGFSIWYVVTLLA